MTNPRHVLVTGTSRGIGEHLARHYLAQGDVVVGCARGVAPLEHERYTHLRLDVSDGAAVRNAFLEIRRRLGRLDVVINNAGVASMNPVVLTPIEAARDIMMTNFMGTFHMAHSAIRLLRHSNAARIVNLTTVAVPLRLDGEALYAASKSAVETFTRIVAREVGPLGITCNAVGPSPIKTRLTAGVPSEKMERLIARQAIPRWADLEDVTNVIDFFLQPSSRMVTGQVVYLGGAG